MKNKPVTVWDVITVAIIFTDRAYIEIPPLSSRLTALHMLSCMLGWYNISLIHRTLTLTKGSLTRVYGFFQVFACIYTSETLFYSLLSCCFTSTEARWPIRDGGRVGRGRQSEGSTAETVRKRPERPWTAARTMEVLRRCPFAIAQRLVHCAIAVSTAVLDRVTKTMSVALLLTNNLHNLKQKMSNLLIPAPPPYSWSLLGQLEGPAPPPSSKISWSFDLAWNPHFIVLSEGLL